MSSIADSGKMDTAPSNTEGPLDKLPLWLCMGWGIGTLGMSVMFNSVRSCDLEATLTGGRRNAETSETTWVRRDCDHHAQEHYCVY